jgi:hypothetical protein
LEWLGVGFLLDVWGLGLFFAYLEDRSEHHAKVFPGLMETAWYSLDLEHPP